MRHRTLANMLGIHRAGGLYAVLSDQLSIDEAVIDTDQPNLFFLDAEPRIPNPADIIASRRFAKLVAALEEKYQYVIFDTPPVGTFVDAAEVAAITDGTIYVIRQDFAKRNEILAAFDQLNKAEVNVIGTVMNCCETSSHDYYYSYYGGDKGQNDAAAGVNPAVGGAAATGTPAKAKRFKK